MKTTGWQWAAVGALLFCGCSYLLVQQGQIQTPITERIKLDTEKERGLKFQSPVSIEYSRKDQTKKLLREMIERDYTAEEMQNLQKGFYALGLIDKIEENLDDLINLYAEQVAGFYDPVTKKLYLTDWLNKRDILLALFEFIIQRDLSGELLLSHELTHALQDQHYDLEKFILEDKENLDMILARHSVSEGEATAVGFNVVARRFGKTVEDSPELPKMIQKEASRFGSGLENLSPIIREQLLFPYYGGLYFIRELLVAQGWKGMEEVYRRPPRSTEQIIHPEKFLKVLDEPKRLKKPDLGFLKKSGYQSVQNNTLGELGIRVMLSQRAGKKKGKIAAEGWGNDLYMVWEIPEKPPDQGLAFVWLTVWDSELDAREFFTLYQKGVQKRRKKGGLIWDEEKPNQLFGHFGNGRMVWILKSEETVVVIEGFSEELTEKIAAAF